MKQENKEQIFERVFGHKKLKDEVDTDWSAFEIIWKSAQKEIINNIKKWVNSDASNWGMAHKKDCVCCGASYYEHTLECPCGSKKFKNYKCINEHEIINKLKKLSYNSSKAKDGGKDE